jgi:hypothetical protein
MANKRFWLGILVLALVFGMMVVGCEEEEDLPLPFSGSIEITGGNYGNPVVGETLTATSTKSGYGTPAWQWYRGDTVIGETNSYKVVSSDIGSRLTVHATYDGYKGYDYKQTTVVVGIPQTAQVALSLDTYISGSSYNVEVKLTLSDGTWNNSIIGNDVVSWFTMSGTPDVSDWGGIWSTLGQTITITYVKGTYTGTQSISNLTVTLNSSKLSEMKNKTNVIDNLFAGLPVSSSEWVQR